MLRFLKTSLPLAAAVAMLALTPCLSAQVSQARFADRIAGPIDESNVVTLMGNIHPLARPEYDHGVIAAETRLERMVLVLAPSAGQQQELDALTEAQQEPNSGLYHQWLTPAEYGARFGVSSADLTRITAWLSSHGFTIEPVPAGRRLVIFSGTAGQVADAFHAEIHQYLSNGAMHIANSQDPQIPAALAPVVTGLLSLHDFRRTSAIRPAVAVAHPENTQGSTHYLFPADYVAIYDLKPLYAAAKNGSGASIAIVGRSNINLSDVSNFRSGSGLIANQPTVIFDGPNPGLVPGDQDESTLDVEWSGAVAPGASIKFVVGGSTATSDGVDLSAQYIVNNKTATVMSTSYGNCEAYIGSGGMAFYNSLWQQAATEGISSFVSSGDSGAAGCNGGSSSAGSMAGVNGLCSSPYSTCVGGTEFDEGSGNYWSATNGPGGGSALGYIPEKVWNESAKDGGSGLWSSGGGISEFFVQPSWQKGISGANSNGMRAVPDVALTASSHDGYLICENGNWYVIAGTSAASPSFAGIMALVVEKENSAAQGNANPALYGMLSAGVNPFHSTPTGNNSVPGVNGFTASGASYNLATGLGSVDANLLVEGWPSAGATKPGFSLKPSVASISSLPGKSTSFTVAVSGTGGFSAAVSLTAKLPSGVTLTFSPASVKPGASATAILTIAGSVAAQTGNITITGTSGSTAATASLSLTVIAPPTLIVANTTNKVTMAQGQSGTLMVTTTTGGSFSGAVTLAVTGLPSGVTAAWTGGSFTSTVDGSHISTLTFKASTTAAVASTGIKITATGDGLTAQSVATVQVTAAPAVTIAVSPAQISMSSVAIQVLTATLTPVGGVSFKTSAAGAIFKIAGLPAGISAKWGAPALTATGTLQARLTLTGSSTAIAGTTRPTISASVTDSLTGKVYNTTLVETLSVTPAAKLDGQPKAMPIARRLP